MKKIYNYVKKEKWPLIFCTTMLLGAGTMVDGIYNSIINLPKPNDYAVAKYLKKVESRLDKQVSLRDLLNPVFRHSLEKTLAEL